MNKYLINYMNFGLKLNACYVVIKAM